MARRQPPPEIKRAAELTLTQLRLGIDRLTKLIERVRQFDPQSITEQYNIAPVDQLSAAIDDVLVRTFGKDTLEYDRYRYAAEFDNGPHNYAFHVAIEEVWQSLARSKASSIALLEQAVESLKERLAEHESLAEPAEQTYGAVTPAQRLRKEALNQKIRDKVSRLFEHGQYDTAVFEAMKAVEVAVRTAAGLTARDIGKDLMRKAFDVNAGSLTDMQAEIAERQARSDLFAGAIGSYKNPHSHRNVALDDPDEAAEIIMLANHLLRIVDARATARSAAA